MTKEELFEFHRAFCDSMVMVAYDKNHDYTGNNSNPFANFNVVETLGVTSTEVGFLTRMLDKFQRLNSFVQTGSLKVKDESVQDTLKDLANYCVLLAAYLKGRSSRGK